MGLSLIPEEEVPNFREAFRWVRFADSFDFSPKLVSLSFIHGWCPLRCISVIVLRRRYDKRKIPFMMFVISFANLSMQIALPCPAKDQHIYGGSVMFPPFPTAYEFRKSGVQVGHGTLNLSGTDKVSDDRAEFGFSFDEVVEVPAS